MNNTSGFSFKLQSMLFSIVVLLGSMFFPFRKQMSVFNFQLILLPYLFILLTFIAMFFYMNKLQITSKFTNYFNEITIKHLTCSLAILFEIFMFWLFFLQSKKFSSFGYCLNKYVAITCFCIILICLTISFSHKVRTSMLFGIIITAYIITYIISIVYFPLHPGRSDMLLLIEVAGKNFLNANSPYSLYFIPHALPLTYLPGMWLSYLPAVIVNIDIRFVNLFCIVLSMILIYYFAEETLKEKAVLLIAIFLLNPLFQFRHEIYLGVYFLPVVVSYYLLIRNKPLLSSIFVGWTIVVYQFSWIIYPLFLVYLYRNYGIRHVLRSIFITLLIIAFVIVPFFMWSPENFILGVFTHWKNVFNVEVPNLTFWILKIIPIGYLKIVQSILLFIMFLLAFKKIVNLTDYFKWCTFTLLLFIITNQLIWNYFFFIIFLYMMFFALSLFQQMKKV